MLPNNDAQPPDQAPLLPDSSGEAAPTPPSGSRIRLRSPAALAGCIFLEALTLLVLVAFCATLVGVSFLRQALLTPPASATPAVVALITPEPAPTETVTPTPPIPTAAPATPSLAAPTPTATLTPTHTPTATPRRYTVFLPVVVRAPSP